MLNVQEVFDLAVKVGIKNDPRGKKQVEKDLHEQKKKYEKMPKEEKQFFNQVLLTNPYADSAIHYLGKNPQVKKIVMGIDIGGSELLLVDQYNRNNPDNKIDLVIAHHPTGTALFNLTKVMPIQKHIVEKYGVPINQGEKIMEPRIGEVRRSLFPGNHQRVVDMARMLDIPFMNIHTPGDNCCHNFLEKLLIENSKKIEKVGGIIDVLMTVPEFIKGKKLGPAPEIWSGEKDSLAWKIVITGMTGGTSWDKDIYEQYAKAGVWTVLEMHISDKNLEAVKKHNLNMVNTTHMASDSLGINVLLDEVEKEGVEIMALSWFIRVSRNN